MVLCIPSGTIFRQSPLAMEHDRHISDHCPFKSSPLRHHSTHPLDSQMYDETRPLMMDKETKQCFLAPPNPIDASHPAAQKKPSTLSLKAPSAFMKKSSISSMLSLKKPAIHTLKAAFAPAPKKSKFVLRPGNGDTGFRRVSRNVGSPHSPRFPVNLNSPTKPRTAPNSPMKRMVPATPTRKSSCWSVGHDPFKTPPRKSIDPFKTPPKVIVWGGSDTDDEDDGELGTGSGDEHTDEMDVDDSAMLRREKSEKKLVQMLGKEYGDALAN